jgi:hypothetical protein
MFYEFQFTQVYLSIYLSLHPSPISGSSPFVGTWLLFQFPDPIHSRVDTLNGVSARREAATYTQDNTNRINAHRHPCLAWDSNLWPQCSSGRRQLMPQTARPLRSADLLLTYSFQWFTGKSISHFPSIPNNRKSSSWEIRIHALKSGSCHLAATHWLGRQGGYITLARTSEPAAQKCRLF